MGNIKCIDKNYAKNIMYLFNKNLNNIPYISGPVLNCLLNNLASCCTNYVKKRSFTGFVSNMNQEMCYNKKIFNIECLLLIDTNSNLNYFIPNLTSKIDELPNDFFLKSQGILHDYYLYYNNSINCTILEEWEYKFKSACEKITPKNFLEAEKIKTLGEFYQQMNEVGVSTPQNVYYQILLLETLFSLAFAEKAVTKIIKSDNVVVNLLRKKFSGVDQISIMLDNSVIHYMPYSKKGEMNDDEFRTYNTFLKIYNSLDPPKKNNLVYLINHN